MLQMYRPLKAPKTRQKQGVLTHTAFNCLYTIMGKILLGE